MALDDVLWTERGPDGRLGPTALADRFLAGNRTLVYHAFIPEYRDPPALSDLQALYEQPGDQAPLTLDGEALNWYAVVSGLSNIAAVPELIDQEGRLGQSDVG